MSRRKILLILFICFIVPVAGVFSYLGVLQIANNFHEVLPGELYRSGQLKAHEIADAHQAYGIQSIINLRGENEGEDWYEIETAEAKKLSITHYDFPMLSEKELTKDEAKELIAIMRDAPKPLLIHCQAGANRTSLASALYMAAVEMETEKESEEQMSLRYGYFPLVFRYTKTMRESFDKLEHMFHYKNTRS
jgi:protein tyrosine/serine phosphatase